MTKKLQTFSTVSFLFLFSLLNSQFHGFIYLPSLTNYIIIFLFPTLVHLPIPTPFRLSFHQSGLFDFSFNLLTLARQHPSNHIYTYPLILAMKSNLMSLALSLAAASLSLVAADTTATVTSTVIVQKREGLYLLQEEPNFVATKTAAPSFVALVARQDAGNTTLISSTDSISSTLSSSSLLPSTTLDTSSDISTDASSSSESQSTTEAASSSETSAAESTTSSEPSSTVEQSSAESTTTTTDEEASSTSDVTSAPTSDIPTSFITTVDITSTFTTTAEDSTSTSASSATSEEASATSGSSSSTSSAEADNSDKNSSGGLSTKNRNIIIGVVVGVGGFLLLLGVAFVCWRIWGRRSGISSGRGSRIDKPLDENSDAFRANIDQYHAPRPNAAANF